MDIFRYSGRCGDRLALADLLNGLGLLGEAVEVGCWRGDYSAHFLRRWRGAKLYLVDPWAPLDDYHDVRNSHFDPADFAFAVERFRQYGERAEIMRMLSADAVGRFADGSLDFVYLDANHSYEHITADLAAWWPKVRPDGVLAGHDIFSQVHPGVTSAVAEFCLAHGLTCDLTLGDYDRRGVLANAASYFVFKPG